MTVSFCTVDQFPIKGWGGLVTYIPLEEFLQIPVFKDTNQGCSPILSKPNRSSDTVYEN